MEKLASAAKPKSPELLLKKSVETAKLSNAESEALENVDVS